MKFSNVRFLVGDFPKVFHFWQDIMGLKASFSDEGMGYAYFPLDTTGIELMSREGFAASIGETTPSSASTGRQGVLVLNVDDVDATFSDLVTRGVTVVAPPKDRAEWGARAAHIADPEGNLIEIFTKLA